MLSFLISWIEKSTTSLRIMIISSLCLNRNWRLCGIIGSGLEDLQWFVTFSLNIKVVLLTSEMFGQFTRENAETPAATPSLPRYKGAGTSNRKNLLDFFQSLRTGSCGDVRVRLGRLSEMVNTSMIESLDFLVSKENSDVEDWHRVLKTDFKALACSKNLNPETTTVERVDLDINSPKRRSFGNLLGESAWGRSPVYSFYLMHLAHISIRR
jgi:hypothetical protein